VQNTHVPDVDAIVVGAGHNGLVTAAYLARAGLSTLLVEARDSVGGTAASEQFAGVTVNICNCDHITFRTTPIADELRLHDHGLRYLDIEPAQMNMAWSGGAAWPLHHDVDQTLDALGRLYPSEVDGYRRYIRAAVPAMRLVLANANEPPTARRIARRLFEQRGRGAATLLRWSRRSAASVMRQFFTHDALRGPAMVTGPMVWGISPEFAGSGLGALTYALRHVGQVGRPVGGSGAVPEALQRAFEAAGGTVRIGAAVSAIVCQANRVAGVELSDGTQISAPVVVSACNPHDTFLRWLRNPPAIANGLRERWQNIPHAEGYESKIDGVLKRLVTLKANRNIVNSAACTTIISPSLDDIHKGYQLMAQGAVMDRPALFLNVPTVADPSMAPAGTHVLSLEALYTPYSLRGGWPSSNEPARWLDRFAELCEPGFRETLGEWRAMTPDVYESDFRLPAGHATSFAGGPLAAVRNKNPELTRYETEVPGLYLTGAATFPGAGVWGASGRNAALVVLGKHA
jgi:beta-carotene ketolase (CrtO type)